MILVSGTLGFAALAAVCAPGENRGGEPVLGAARVFMDGGLQFGENGGHFALWRRGHPGAQFADAIVDASSGRRFGHAHTRGHAPRWQICRVIAIQASL